MGHLLEQHEPGDDLYPVGLEVSVVGTGYQCGNKLDVSHPRVSM